MDENNPYEAPLKEVEADHAPGTSQSWFGEPGKRVFIVSYVTSLVVAVTVVAVWLYVMFVDSTRTRLPDILEVVFLIVTTLPSVVTCSLFSLCYCSIVKVRAKRKMWPAVLFGAISGLIFNAMTGITVIESLFEW